MSEKTQPTTTAEPTANPEPIRERYRVRFQKTGLLRWISHRDLARLWERLVRRAQLVLSMTEGFHPKPRIAFPSALALGTESLDEVVELELAERMSPLQLLERLVADNQPGLFIQSVAHLPPGFGKGQMKESKYRIAPPEIFVEDEIRDAIKRLSSQPRMEVERKKKTHSFEVATEILQLDWKSNAIEMTLNAGGGASLKPTDLLGAMGLGDWIENGAAITRTQLILRKEFTDTNPETFVHTNT